jgi:adenosine deaminase CECR1
MVFGLAKERMKDTKLWTIVRKMPKGALLHAHLDAMVDFEWLFETMLEEKGMHIYCDRSLTGHLGLHHGILQFCFRKRPTRETNIWKEDYVPNEPVPVLKAAEEYPDGGREGFLKYLHGRFTISVLESIEHHHGIDHMWRKFQTVFSMINGIVFYEPIFRKFLQRMMHLLHTDGVHWVDLRLAFGFKYYRAGRETPEKGYESLMRAFGEELDKYKATEEGETFWGYRLIWTSIRALDTRKIVEDMDTCITMKIQFPHLIAGYDLVGQEDLGRPLKDVLPELFWFRKQCADEGLNIPFFFHAGETVGDGNDTDQNLFDAILLGTRRIGHGFSLYKHPLLIDMVKEKKILVESCPISNEVLRLCASIMTHPLPALLARGVTCSLCNDDPGILGQDTAGSTHDFWQALQGWDNLGLEGLGSLAQNSVLYAAYEDQTNAEWQASLKAGMTGKGTRGERMRQWAVLWEEFCLWVVTEFGDYLDDDEAEEAGEIQAEGKEKGKQVDDLPEDLSAKLSIEE